MVGFQLPYTIELCWIYYSNYFQSITKIEFELDKCLPKENVENFNFQQIKNDCLWIKKYGNKKIGFELDKCLVKENVENSIFLTK